MFDKIVEFVKEIYGDRDFIPLHEPKFVGNEKKYLNDCIDSTFVSSVGKFVDRFEEKICEYTKSAHAVAVTNGTAALHTALVFCGVKLDDEVLTQALTFVATANSIKSCYAHPIFVDSAADNLGMCPDSLESFLEEHGQMRDDGFCYNKTTGRRIKACVPMHVFGHPVKIKRIIEVCDRFNIEVVEDAAESLGSYVGDQHTGTFSKIGILSFNGNKTVTSGGGGMLLMQDEQLAKQIKHMTTTAKVSHKWDFYHDMVGFNYRLPNINAALACAQMEFLPKALESKRETAKLYADFFEKIGVEFIKTSPGTTSNYWLNAIMLKDRAERDECLEHLNANGVMARPVWILMNKLPAFKDCQTTSLVNAEKYEDRIVNIPSSVRI